MSQTIQQRKILIICFFFAFFAPILEADDFSDILSNSYQEKFEKREKDRSGKSRGDLRAGKSRRYLRNGGYCSPPAGWNSPIQETLDFQGQLINTSYNGLLDIQLAGEFEGPDYLGHLGNDLSLAERIQSNYASESGMVFWDENDLSLGGSDLSIRQFIGVKAGQFLAVQANPSGILSFNPFSSGGRSKAPASLMGRLAIVSERIEDVVYKAGLIGASRMVPGGAFIPTGTIIEHAAPSLHTHGLARESINDALLLASAGMERAGYHVPSYHFAGGMDSLRVTANWETATYNREGGAWKAAARISINLIPLFGPISRSVGPTLKRLPWVQAGQAIARAWQGMNDFLRSLGFGSGTAYCGIPHHVYDIIVEKVAILFKIMNVSKLTRRGIDAEDVAHDIWIKLNEKTGIDLTTSQAEVRSFIDSFAFFYIRNATKLRAMREDLNHLDDVTDQIPLTLSVDDLAAAAEEVDIYRKALTETYEAADGPTRKIVDFYMDNLGTAKHVGAGLAEEFAKGMGRSRPAVSMAWTRFKRRARDALEAMSKEN